MVRTAKILPKGQITIPREVRDALGAAEGDIIVFHEVGGSWTVSRQPARLVEFMRMAGREGRPVSEQELADLDATARSCSAGVGRKASEG